MRRERGLTLIEVLVALAILSAVVGSLMVLLGQQTRQAVRLEDRALARIAAENAMTAYFAAKRTGRAIDLEGEEEIGGRTFRYQIDREPANLEGFQSVTAQVTLGEDRQVIASLSTIEQSTRVVTP